VDVGRRRLSFADALRRYHLPRGDEAARSYWEDPPQRIIDTIGRYERIHDRRRSDRVVLTYTVNGGAQHQWRWPHQ
jgi:hypothetical protein